jgi:hypothetical protein
MMVRRLRRQPDHGKKPLLKKRRGQWRYFLRLPDLYQARSAVLNFANSLFHHQFNAALRPKGKLQTAFHIKTDSSIQNIIQLPEAAG